MLLIPSCCRFDLPLQSSNTTLALLQPQHPLPPLLQHTMLLNLLQCPVVMMH